MIILDGKNTAQKIVNNLKIELEKYPSKPRLDIILVGDDPASLQYDEMKQRKAAEIGINGEIHHLAQDSTTTQVISLVERLNNDNQVTAFMIQLPLPPQIDTSIVLNTIDPKKDADGLTSTNLGLLFQKKPEAIASATPLGVVKLLEEYNIDVSGKNTVIIGRSHFIGLPLLALLLGKNSTVTICHSYTKDLQNICKNADILITSAGKSKLITKDFVKNGAIVIDVGLSSDLESGKLVGDVDFEAVSQVASFITPVPGGVGPMTIAALISNTVEIFKKNNITTTKYEQ
ncbi:MAG: bifunctional 5,10-methylenetetrahydrofolate dehydrogenase/5,10-methenyltetrahydrofolate cyclohydrolase [Candidatus Shapirobacteria bacterium]